MCLPIVYVQEVACLLFNKSPVIIEVPEKCSLTKIWLIHVPAAVDTFAFLTCFIAIALFNYALSQTLVNLLVQTDFPGATKF